MADRTDPARPPSPGPWPVASTPDRIFDHSAEWCVSATGHPGESDYPDPARHIPPFECRSRAGWVDAVTGLDGDRLDLAVYVARPFRFGQPRATTPARPARIVLDAEPVRLSLSPGDALRLARQPTRFVDLLDRG